MQQAQTTLTVETGGKDFVEITGRIKDWLAGQDIEDGLLTVFIRHTSASLMIQENADPDVLRDLRDFLEALAPDEESLYRHTAEGPDDMPAHIKAALTQTHLSVPVASGKPLLGTWQGVYVCEHRARGATRNVVLHLTGE